MIFEMLESDLSIIKMNPESHPAAINIQSFDTLNAVIEPNSEPGGFMTIGSYSPI